MLALYSIMIFRIAGLNINIAHNNKTNRKKIFIKGVASCIIDVIP
jgi:hypothetical protein